jgi:SAM-dependent methyltransferase
LRSTFGRTALRYDKVRPGYPEELFEDLVSLSGIPAGRRVFEVGCGTGQATLPLARRGYGMLCVELGENLAALARDNAAEYPRVQVVTGDFEKIPVPQGVFDLLLSATAFHWLAPAVAHPKAAAQALKPGGAIAVVLGRARAPRQRQGLQTEASGRGFFEAAQRVPAREARQAPEIWDESYAGPPLSEDLPGRTEEIDRPGFFGPVAKRSYR